MSVQGKLTLRNYRCFSWENPAVLEFGDGFTAFVGSNNLENQLYYDQFMNYEYFLCGIQILKCRESI